MKTLFGRVRSLASRARKIVDDLARIRNLIITAVSVTIIFRIFWNDHISPFLVFLNKSVESHVGVILVILFLLNIFSVSMILFLLKRDRISLAGEEESLCKELVEKGCLTLLEKLSGGKEDIIPLTDKIYTNVVIDAQKLEGHTYRRVIDYTAKEIEKEIKIWKRSYATTYHTDNEYDNKIPGLGEINKRISRDIGDRLGINSCSPDSEKFRAQNLIIFLPVPLLASLSTLLVRLEEKGVKRAVIVFMIELPISVDLKRMVRNLDLHRIYLISLKTIEKYAPRFA